MKFENFFKPKKNISSETKVPSAKSDDEKLRSEIIKKIDWDLSGNPNESYKPGSLKDTEGGYIAQVEKMAQEKMDDPVERKKIEEAMENMEKSDFSLSQEHFMSEEERQKKREEIMG